MNKIFLHSLEKMNRTKTLAHRIYGCLCVTRAVILGVIVSGLWNSVSDGSPLLNIICGAVTSLVILIYTPLRRSERIKESDLLLSLDIQYPASSNSPFIDATTSDDTSEWQSKLEREQKKQKSWELRRLWVASKSVLILTFVAGFLLMRSPLDLKAGVLDARNILTALTGGVTLEVLDGLAPKKGQKLQLKRPILLSTSNPPSIELIPSNMLKLTVVRMSGDQNPPVINLKPHMNATPLTIQMSPTGSTQSQQNIWTAEFSAPESADLSIPIISSKVSAKILVTELPTPKVQMTFDGAGRELWPDHELLSLNINISSVHPLDRVLLKITTKDKTFQESVLNISGDTTTVTTTYKLNLQPWMEDDLVEFDIVAEATDRAEPSPLTGKSQPLHIKVASAYGRYKQALETLRKVKSAVDDARSSDQAIAAGTDDVMRSVLKQSEETPFFDGIDRSQLAQMSQKLRELKGAKNAYKLQELADELGDFLLEHEILDDRERDRDLFIAIRAFSRTLDKPNPARTIESKHLATRTNLFLDERQKRWAIRVKFLGPGNEPKSWTRIRNEKPFNSKVNRTLNEAESNPKKSQGHLSALASEYRAWLEELEAKEDAVRARQEKQRQQGLANARNELRELQQRQDQISTDLDRAAQRPDEIKQKWPSTRAGENTNIAQARGLLGKLKALSPTAGERLSAAVQAMEFTVNAGEGMKWVESESAADLAGRLLRDADKAANKSQKQPGRGRRRRSGGDEYHGTSIGGQVEIKSDYQVDPRYREHILRDVEDEISDGENKSILDGWLHEVVR
jgi:hypothetical protein